MTLLATKSKAMITKPSALAQPQGEAVTLRFATFNIGARNQVKKQQKLDGFREQIERLFACNDAVCFQEADGVIELLDDVARNTGSLYFKSLDKNHEISSGIRNCKTPAPAHACPISSSP